MVCCAGRGIAPRKHVSGGFPENDCVCSCLGSSKTRSGDGGRETLPLGAGSEAAWPKHVAFALPSLHVLPHGPRARWLGTSCQETSVWLRRAASPARLYGAREHGAVLSRGAAPTTTHHVFSA